jgi:hypothetical protein
MTPGLQLRNGEHNPVIVLDPPPPLAAEGRFDRETSCGFLSCRSKLLLAIFLELKESLHFVSRVDFIRNLLYSKTLPSQTGVAEGTARDIS